MFNCRALFKGKRITVLGLGLLGRGVGDVEFLAKCGAIVLVTDQKTEVQLAASVDKLKQYKNVSFRLGGHDERDFVGRDLVIKGAKVPLDSPYIAAARKAGVPVVMSTALFAKYAMQGGAIIVGITGTRGKSTVTHMIYHSLQQARKRVHLGGNVRGISTLAMLPEIKKGDIAVLELDSWQLQGFGDLKISPHVAIFTNLMPDHQDYYKSMDEYFRDKENIFKYQNKWDTLVLGNGLKRRFLTAHTTCEPLVPDSLAPDWKLRIPGEHNRENAALAAAALRALGLSETDIKSGLESFPGLEGRLQFVGTVQGVHVYNDTSATTPEATIAALRAVGDKQKKNVVLILGGDEKFLDMWELLAEIPKWCSKVVLFKERGTERIRDDVFALSAKGIDVYEEEGLPATVSRAFSAAVPGETILFSPAFTSFGKYFKNEFDRGNQFMKLVRKRL
ncbi:MAG: UDP-N-acetylmuramoylalanine-D-glutamate ligase [Candidatus Kaiserbacteria bacterium GW2011_GWA2_49_19]|uniref:UDP-N-acetylmuramoylalanine--D-glutamate ligase n=1 Tax=Candidatus Kaiserbacteria bacterium GW2011_GWA2_49_19 TaxID=1618669 RepID=A0A0G1VPJ4_9BACT|nr:MAG: UDP-N-acetylmuramoylalanine-D-glutamate ligase [Candidatus Kaiserbacteria bacterium GW2011_GWA2_49_19]